jgi:hypothetical protein
MRATRGSLATGARLRSLAYVIVIVMLVACGAPGGTPSPSGTEVQAQGSARSSATEESATPVESASTGTLEAALPSDCPAPPLDLGALIALDADPGPLSVEFRPAFGVYNERAAACYGDRPLTFRAFVAEPEGLGGTTNFEIEPAWIASPTFAVQPSGELLGPPAFGVGPYLVIGVRPGEGDPLSQFAGSWVQVTGHFADAVAASCRASGSNGRIPSVDEAMAICRATFVLDSIEPAAAP